jgi:hypothetical protein
MSPQSVTYLVGACAGVFGFAAYVGLIAVPAWQSYSNAWQRAGAVFLTLYVLATMVGLGILAGAALVFYSDQLPVV